MKKNLLLAVLLIHLLPIIYSDDYSSVSAQNMTFENGSWLLPDLEVNGKEKEKCDQCGEYYDADDYANHECMVTCEYCNEKVNTNRYEHHMETMHPNLFGKTRCVWCQELLTEEEYMEHDCRNFTVVGQGGGSGHGSNGNGTTVIGNGGNSGGNTVWNFGNDDDKNKETDNEDENIDGKDPKNNEDSNKPPYLVQECQLCCVPTTMAIMKMYAKGLTLEEAKKAMQSYKEVYQTLTDKSVEETGVLSNEIKRLMNECGFTVSPCTIESISKFCDVPKMQVFVLIDVDEFGHALDLIGVNKDENGNVTSYQCINPGTGLVETHNAEEFTHPTEVFYIRDIK
jgi:predicted nucleic acid-binding Zn ribbon protein